METSHWSSDPYWTDALKAFTELRRSGQSHLTLDLEAIESILFNGGGPAYKLIEAMCSVKEHEGSEGYRGAPRLVLALLAVLNEQQNRPRPPS